MGNARRRLQGVLNRKCEVPRWLASRTVCWMAAGGALLLACQVAQAQHATGYELPVYVGSPDGTIITGQDGFYIPVPDSQDGLVYTYAGNALGLPQNFTGGEQFVGVTGGDTGLPVPFARAQRDMVYGDGTGVWTTSFDIAITYVGDLPSAQNIGSFSTQVFASPPAPAEQTFIALARWSDPATATNWNADYVWFDSAGTQLLEQVPDPAFQNLLTNRWYRWCTTYDLDTNAIVAVSITDLTSGVTTTHNPVDRYMFGGTTGGATGPPTGFRYFGGSNTAAGNTLGFDNLSVEEGQASCAVICDPECSEGTVCVQGACCGDGVLEGHEECDPGGCGTCPWDVDGSGGVGPFDLAVLLGNWGPLPPDPDPAVVCLVADDDGDIGPLELANLLGNWGPCPPPLGGGDDQCPEADCTELCECIGRGACCGIMGDPGACDEDLTADECAKAGGAYAGDDTTCEDCPDPVCFGVEGSCFEDHGDPGCCNPICCGIVCEIDPVCCEGYDDICVGIAQENCDPASCGDGCCDPGEDECNCSEDCPGVCPFCGDGNVDPGEDCDPPGPAGCPGGEVCLGDCTCGDLCGDGICGPGENECNCNQDCAGVCPFSCTVFNNQADFEAFNEGEGKVQKGVEDFEETAPGTGIAGFDDPLCGGIPTTPPVFPNGIDELNLCVQSNLLGGAPDVPSPTGANALVFVELGAGFGETSDLVIANYFVDSIDLMFGDPVPPDQQDNHTGVGFDTVTLLGGNSVEIRVYSKNNEQMLSATSPADPAGSNFWGVWCEDTIGRINIFDPADGAEGGDNIQMWKDGP